jgi:hypothetical protein
MAPLGDAERAEVVAASPLRGKYDRPVERESAYELLGRRAASRAPAQEASPAPGGGRAAGGGSEIGNAIAGMAKSAARAAGSQLGREIMRGLLGSIFGGGRRR